MLQKKFLVSKP
jgi:hypothetical protein